jgi:tetratricopeptide (TPR) repeat protein
VQPRPSVTQPVSPPAAPEPALVPSSPILSGSNPAAVVPPTLDINGQIGRQTAAPQSNPPVPRRALTPSVPSAGANQAPPPAAAQSPVAVATVAPQPTAPAPTYYDNSTSGNAAAALMPTTTVTVLPAKPLDSAAANNELSPSFTSPSIVINGVSGGGVPVSGRGNASPNALGEQVSSVAQATIDQGDTALKVSDYLTAIQLYRKAVDMSPRAVTPRLRLANAYLDDGMKDQAVGVAQRALAIDPGNTDIQKFIQAQDTGANGPDGDVIIAQAQTRNDPTNPAGWISLGDAYWNTGDPDDSLISYKRAEEIDPNSIIPQTRLAKLYAARAQYDQSLAALQKSGTDGYPYALRIISSRSESLVGDIDDETQDLIKGVDTREQFYDRIKTTSSQAAGLSDFVSKIKPPDQYKISHLHRELATSLLAQTAAVWVDYAETNNDSDKDEAADLEKHAISEMKIASVAEDLQSRIKP